MYHTRKIAVIQELCDITSSKRIYASEYQGHGIPFYRGKEIIEKYSGKTQVSTKIFIKEEKFQEINRKFGSPKQGELLLTSVGTLGIPYIVKKEEKFYFKDGNLIWFKNWKNLDSKYFYYWLLSPNGKSELKKCTIGSSQSAYTIVLLKKMEILLPPLPTQRKIAAILSAYDDLIENNTRRIHILEDMAQAIYREWFVHFRFPGHEDVKMVESELGIIPEGWIESFPKIVDYKEGPGLRNWQYRPNGLPFLNIRTLKNNDIDFTKVQYLDPNEVMDKYQHFLLKEYDHVVSSSGTLGRIVTIQKQHLPLLLNTSIIRMRPRSIRVGKWQLKHFLLSNYFQDQILSFATGSAQLNYGPSHLKKMLIISPSEKIGVNYENLVGPVEEMIILLLQKNLNLRKTRDLLLPQLISGKLDVSEMEIEG